MIEVTKENFDTEVLAAEGLVFVDFWSPKCGPCMELLPEVESLAKKHTGKAKFCKLDTASNKRLSIAQKVMGIPTFVFYKNGEKVFTFDKESIEMTAVEAKLNELA
ncbi:MAG: thioredoxin domain-containing protein [Clostridiales bacterium]|nr:thioredoxin domain-containing protein [Clostridiales bacterium]